MAKPIPKTWEFYRRTGFLWSDPYHLPEGKKKFVERPDLDEKYHQYLRKQDEKDKATQEQQLREQKRRIKRIRSRMQAKQMENAEKDLFRQLDDSAPVKVRGSEKAKKLLTACKKQAACQSTKNGHNIKDQYFYRRTGSLWTDLKLVPQERFHLVVNENMLEKDWEALEHIQERLNQEDELEQHHQWVRMKRAEKIKEGFQKRRAENDCRLRRLGIGPVKSSKPSSLSRPHSASPAIERKSSTDDHKKILGTNNRARPSSSKSCARSTSPVPHFVQTTDHAGLLHFDRGARAHFSLKRVSSTPSTAQEEVQFRVVDDIIDEVSLDSMSGDLVIVDTDEKRKPLNQGSMRQCSRMEVEVKTTSMERKLSLELRPTVFESEELGDEVSLFRMRSSSEKPESCTSQEIRCHVRPELSLSAPRNVISELDDFEDRLRFLEENGETKKPFYLGKKATHGKSRRIVLSR